MISPGATSIPANRDGDIDRVDRHGTVTGGDAAEQVLEFHRANLVDVARGTIGNRADAADSLHGSGHIAAGQADLALYFGRKLLLEDEDRRLGRSIEGVENVHEANAAVIGVGASRRCK